MEKIVKGKLEVIYSVHIPDHRTIEVTKSISDKDLEYQEIHDVAELKSYIEDIFLSDVSVGQELEDYVFNNSSICEKYPESYVIIDDIEITNILQMVKDCSDMISPCGDNNCCVAGKRNNYNYCPICGTKL